MDSSIKDDDMSVVVSKGNAEEAAVMLIARFKFGVVGLCSLLLELITRIWIFSMGKCRQKSQQRFVNFFNKLFTLQSLKLQFAHQRKKLTIFILKNILLAQTLKHSIGS